MSLYYFTHLRVTDTLDVRPDLGRTAYYLDTQTETAITLNIEYLKNLQVDDVYSTDSLVTIDGVREEIKTVTDTIQGLTTSQPLNIGQLAEDLVTSSVYTIDNVTKVSDRLIRNTVFSNRYYSNTFYQPIVPDGYIVASFYQNNTLVAEVQNYAVPSKELNSRTATLIDFAYGFIYALGTENDLLLGELFKSTAYLFTKFGYLPGEFTRYKPKVLNYEVSCYSLSLFSYALVQAIKYYSDRPIAVGLSLGEITDTLEELLSWLSTEIQGRVDIVSGFVYDPDPSIKSTYWASIALGELLSLVYDSGAHETAARVYLAIKEDMHPTDGTSESYLQATTYLWKVINNLDVAEQLQYVRSHKWCDVDASLLWASILPAAELTTLGITRSFNANGLQVITFPDLGTITPANLHQIALTSCQAQRLVRQTPFYLYADEAKAYTAYLHQLAKYMWPTGRLWADENTLTTGLIGGLLKMVADGSYGAVLQTFIMQDSHRVQFLQADQLDNYRPKPFLMSDKHWATWLYINNQLKTLEQKATHWGLVDLGLDAVVETPLTVNNLDIDASNLLEVTTDTYRYSTNPNYTYLTYWLSKLPYDIKSRSVWTTKEFDFANPRDSDDLFYYQRPLSLAEADKALTFYKYEERSTPGFSYHVDAGSLITVADPVEATVDRDYLIRPLSNYSAQCKLSTGWVYNKLPSFTPPGHVVTITGNTASPILDLLEPTSRLAST